MNETIIIFSQYAYLKITQLFASISVDWILGFGTLLLALFAFYTIVKDRVDKYFIHSKLKIDIKVKPPDCHKTSMISSDGKERYDTYYFRFIVENKSKKKVENVEVMISKLFEKKSKSLHLVTDFLPMDLKWSYYGTGSIPLIAPDSFKHCDLGHILKKDDLPKVFPSMPHIKPYSKNIGFVFDLIVQLNTFTFIKEPGNYIIEVLLSSSDMNKGIKKYFEIEIPNNWYDREKDMLKNVKIEEIKSNKLAQQFPGFSSANSTCLALQ